MDLHAETKVVLDKLIADHFCARAVQKDSSLWTTTASEEEKPEHWLGWMTIADTMLTKVDELTLLADTLRDEGYRDVVLLGMGGSSLAAEVMNRTFGSKSGYPTLHVLDTTDPATINDVEQKIAQGLTLFIVSSKSGGTIEPNSLYQHFKQFVEQQGSDMPTGQHFVAITDPGSSLEALAERDGFRQTFHGEPTIGGRYSALSYFGLVPAALIGVDVRELLTRASAMAARCNQCNAQSPGMLLGASMGAAWQSKRDKLTIIVPPALASFGLWAEQLIAESTGKEGKGIVPIAGEPPAQPASYSNDRLFVSLELPEADEQGQRKLQAIEASGQPVYRLPIKDTSDLGAQFYLWEYATAVAGAVLGINAFDQPNVTESKNNTSAILKQFVAEGKLPPAQPSAQQLADLLAGVKPGDYVAIMAYTNPTADHERLLQELRGQIQSKYKVATTLGFGPRFLHSTGQLHKGGANNGVFLQIVTADPHDEQIAGQPYGFSVLKQAQALGDYQSLLAHERRVLRLELSDLNDLARLAV